MSQQINRNALIHGLKLSSQRGIEIGPLVNPIVRREDGNVHYVDRATTENLREWYANDPDVNVDDIMQIDFVWGEQSLAEATGGLEQFDYCIASHVIEHIPDLITWLNEIASVLKVGGIACFAVPDKRYTFDYLRPITTTAELVEDHLNKRRKPSFRHIYDHFSNYTDLDVSTAWQDDFDGSRLKPTHSAKKVLETCIKARDEDSYVDSHCSVFTEDSFFQLLSSISELGLLDFKLKRRFPICPGRFEFFAQLEKIEPDLAREQKHQLFELSVEAAKNTYLRMNFVCDNQCVPKLYYDTGIGFNETQSHSVQYNHEGQSQTLQFTLPAIDSIKLRFDPCECEADFSISNMEYSHAGESRTLLSEQFEPLSQICEMLQQPHSFSAKSPADANDPAFTINL